jgi:ligand-binding SRPBCC domain-containing protein
MNLYTLHYTCHLDASVEAVCAFHTDTRNLPLITPPSIKVTIVNMESNSVILDIKKFGITTRWEMELEKNCPKSIVDVMTKGPFTSFRHERIFVAEGENRTRMDEAITLSAPVSLFQSLFFWFVKRDMDAMFAYRHAKTKAYFLAK